MANETRLGILIEARDKASAEIKKINKEIKDLGGAGQKGGGVFAADLEEITQRALGANEALGLLSKGAIGVGIALAAVKGATVAFELGRAASGAMSLRDSFDDLAEGAGTTGDALLASMREAARGTIADADLILSANRAMLLGVAKDAESMGKLIEIAAARGRAMGLSTAQAFNDIVTGIGRASPLILDNLGITVDATAAYERYAQQLGVNANALDDNQKKQAILNDVIALSADLIKENSSQAQQQAEAFQRMDAAIQNAKQALGELFSPAAAAIANNLAEATERMLQAMQDTAMQSAQSDLFGMGDSITRMAAELNAQANNLADAAISGDNAGVGAAAQRIQELTIAIRALGEEYNATAAITGADLLDLNQLANGVVAFQDTSAAAQAAAQAEEEMAAASAELAAQQGALQAQILGTVARLREIEGVANSAASALRSSFLGVADTIGGAAALGGYRKAKQELDAQIAIYEQLGYSAEEIEFATAGFVSQVRDANTELEKTVTNTGRISSGVNTAQQAFESLKSKISGILSGSLSSGIDLENILGRQDAIEEPARRLADIAVNGFNSPWAKYFQEQFPQLYEQLATSGNPRQAAAQILREFEAGLRPELLDRETAKERVRQLLLGESNIEELAASIAQELSAEFGGQFSQAQILQTAQQALGQGAAGALDISTGITAAPGTASKVLGQVEAQFASDASVNKAKAIGAALVRNLFNGYDETAGTLPWWDRLLTIILRQQVEAGA